MPAAVLPQLQLLPVPDVEPVLPAPDAVRAVADGQTRLDLRPAVRVSVPARSTVHPEHEWIRSTVQIGVEVGQGLRSPRFLVPWAAEEVRVRLARSGRLATVAPRPLGRPVVRSVHVCPVGQDVLEATVVMADRSRARAVAVRIETRTGRRRITAWETR